MGLDYSYNLIIKKEKRHELIKNIKDSGDFNDDNCVIEFEVDSFILKYLEGCYDYITNYDTEEIDKYLLSNNKARIGYIYYGEKAINNEEDNIIVSFTAATSDMSILFKESRAIRSWFFELAKKLNSKIMYLDLECYGHEIMCFEGEEIDIKLRGEGHLLIERTKFLRTIKEFSNILETH